MTTPDTPLAARLADALAAELRDAAPGPRVTVSDAERPASLADAVALQDAALGALGWTAVAWKLVGTTHAGVKALGLGGFFSGLNPEGRLLTSPARLAPGALAQAVAEGELAFRFGADLPVRGTDYSEDEVKTALESAHPAIELPQSRFERLGSEGGFGLAGDNGAAGWSIVGEGTPIAEVDLGGAFDVAVTINGEVVGRGSAAVLAASPLALVADHVNRMGRRGYPTRAGEYVLTGSLNTPHDFSAMLGQGALEIVADFGDLGAARLTIGA